MSFDKLRSVLGGRNVWILVIDTKGINVWCAAGKGTFSTQEIVRRVHAHHVQDVVGHRRLIVPQLGAPGVAAHRVKKLAGFSVQYGPIRSRDLPAYLDTGRATEEMRRVTFTLPERVPLIPMELKPALLPVILIAVGIVLAAGWKAGAAFITVGLTAPIAIPLFHDLLPGRWLSIKGAIWGGIVSLLSAYGYALNGLQTTALVFSAVAVSAYLGLNFTGATTYTSVNGVKREMKRMLPVIISSAVLGGLIWIYLGLKRMLT
jgi:acetyl-CoA decarbonylase/synthase complex subunit gamma